MSLFVNLQSPLEKSEMIRLEKEMRPRCLIGRHEKEYLLESTLARFNDSS